jgi:hypothetical protein
MAVFGWHFFATASLTIGSCLPTQGLAQSDVRASTELAVLHVVDGRRIALPVLTVPATDRRQLDNLEWRMDPSPDVSLAVNDCRKPMDTAVGMPSVHCALPRALVARHHHMRKVPTHWWDSRGASYRVLGGRYFEHAGGSGIGFDLGSDHPKALAAVVVLTSERHVRFSDLHVLDAAVWRRWPELARELSAWRKSDAASCPNASYCISKLASAQNLRGVALEYRFHDGRRLQFLRAASRPMRGGTEFLLVKLWRGIDAEGRARVLRDSHEWASGIVTGVTDCQTQCHWNWDKRPEVFTVSGRTFVFGPFSGGTVSGYMFLEVLPHELKLLGEYRWGS